MIESILFRKKLHQKSLAWISPTYVQHSWWVVQPPGRWLFFLIPCIHRCIKVNVTKKVKTYKKTDSSLSGSWCPRWKIMSSSTNRRVSWRSLWNSGIMAVWVDNYLNANYSIDYLIKHQIDYHKICSVKRHFKWLSWMIHDAFPEVHWQKQESFSFCYPTTHKKLRTTTPS